MGDEMKAWHFLAADGRLRDGRPAPAVGETLVHTGAIAWCKSGLYASARVLDALRYAPGPILCRVECGDVVLRDMNKLVCRERTILARADVTDVLREFARRCALDVIDMWDAPDVVRRYLETGDEAIRGAAGDASSDVVGAFWEAIGDALTVWDGSVDATTAAATAAATAAIWATVDAAYNAAWNASDAAPCAVAAWARQNRWLTAMVSRRLNGG